MKNISQEDLIEFMETITEKLKNKILSEDELKHVSEFYMAYKFTDIRNDLTDQELIKFLSLGWYIYKNISDSPEP